MTEDPHSFRTDVLESIFSRFGNKSCSRFGLFSIRPVLYRTPVFTRQVFCSKTLSISNVKTPSFEHDPCRLCNTLQESPTVCARRYSSLLTMNRQKHFQRDGFQSWWELFWKHSQIITLKRYFGVFAEWNRGTFLCELLVLGLEKNLRHHFSSFSRRFFGNHATIIVHYDHRSSWQFWLRNFVSKQNIFLKINDKLRQGAQIKMINLKTFLQTIFQQARFKAIKSANIQHVYML